MPTEYKINTEYELIYSRIFDVATDEEILQHQAKIKSDPQYQPSFDQLIDVRDYTGGVSVDTVKTLARNTSATPDARRAIVVPDDAIFGMSRMFQTLSSHIGNDQEIFREIEPAIEWLGIEKNPF